MPNEISKTRLLLIPTFFLVALLPGLVFGSDYRKCQLSISAAVLPPYLNGDVPSTLVLSGKVSASSDCQGPVRYGLTDESLDPFLRGFGVPSLGLPKFPRGSRVLNPGSSADYSYSFSYTNRPSPSSPSGDLMSTINYEVGAIDMCGNANSVNVQTCWNNPSLGQYDSEYLKFKNNNQCGDTVYNKTYPFAPSGSGPGANTAHPTTNDYAKQLSTYVGPKITDIASAEVSLDPAYVADTLQNKKFTPTPPFSPFDTLRLTLKIKTPCGAPPIEDLNGSYNLTLVTKTSSGAEIDLNTMATPNGYPSLAGWQGGTPDPADPSYSVYYALFVTGNYINGDQSPGLEALIASIAAGRPIYLRLSEAGNLAAKKDVPLKMTNCAQVYGGGNNQIVFMRGKSALLSATSLVDNSAVVSAGFDFYEPYRSNKDLFSFFADLKNHYDATWRDRIVNIAIPGVPTPFPEISSVSSCGKTKRLYIGYLDMPEIKISSSNLPGLYVKFTVDGLSSLRGRHFLMSNNAQLPFLDVTVHEISHALAGVWDETGTYNKVKLPSVVLANCSRNPTLDYSFSGKVYGLTSKIGCFSGQSDFWGDLIYRPSDMSIMRYDWANRKFSDKRFNVVSCGYILKAIKKGSTAKSYFPECAAMPGIIPVGQ